MDAFHSRAGGNEPFEQRREGRMELTLLAVRGGAAGVLWVLGAILVIAGVVALVRGQILAGVALIVLGLLVGPGGVSIF
jgi:hypothetical protein